MLSWTNPPLKAGFTRHVTLLLPKIFITSSFESLGKELIYIILSIFSFNSFSISILLSSSEIFITMFSTLFLYFTLKKHNKYFIILYSKPPLLEMIILVNSLYVALLSMKYTLS